MVSAMYDSTCLACGGAGLLWTWWDVEADIQRLIQYCMQDVLVESEVDAIATHLSDYERKVWKCDQLINDRGVQFDVPMIIRAQKVVEHAKTSLDKRMSDLTDRAVPKATQTGALADWITAQGLPCATVRKGAQEELLLSAEVIDLPQVTMAIEIRRAASKTSVAKLWAITDCAFY